jgi:hypothetical protein
LEASFIRRHAAGIAVAALLAMLLVAPRWWLLATDPASGVRVQVSPWGAGHQGSDEAEYDIVTQAAHQGDLPVRDPLLSGHSQPPQGNAFWQELIGVMSRPFPSIFPGIAVAATIASFVGFLMLYTLAFSAVKSWIAAALLPVAAVVAQIYTQAEGFFDLRHIAVLRAVFEADPGRQFQVWGRFTAPVMLLPLFFGATFALSRAVDSGARRWIAAAAACSALLVYSYLFYWTALALALAGWLCWLLARKDLVAARRLVVVGLITVLLASPELISLAYQGLTMSADVKIRVGVDQGLGIDGSVLARVAERLLIGVALFWAMRSGSRRDALYAALFVAPLALVLVLGVFPQPWHYLINVWPVFALPAAIAGCAGAARRLRPRIPPGLVRLAPVALLALAALCVLHIAVLQVRATREVAAAFALSSDEYAAFSWIDHNVASGQTVVSTSITTNDLLATLTGASVYLPDGFLSHVSDQELFDRYLRASALYGYDEQTTFARIDPALGGADHAAPYELRFESFVSYYLTNWEVVIAPQRIADRMPALRDAFRTLRSSRQPLDAYPADYIYCGHRERFWPARPSSDTYVRVAFHQGESTVYRIVRATDPQAQRFPGCG